MRAWANAQPLPALSAQCERFAQQSRSGCSRQLPGPTGERNLYTLLPREAVLSLADDDGDRLAQLAAVLAVGSHAVWPAQAAALHARLPAAVQACIRLSNDWTQDTVAFDAVLHHGGADALRAVCRQLAQRAGPIVGVTALVPGADNVPLERLVVERALSVNTAAAGGNASLMTIG